VLGDTAYEEVTVDSLKSYDASWGRFLDKTHAVVGNHEYYGDGPDAYWNYFGDRAGTPGEGWYSFEWAPGTSSSSTPSARRSAATPTATRASGWPPTWPRAPHPSPTSGRSCRTRASTSC
jgi:hypothetical protein